MTFVRTKALRIVRIMRIGAFTACGFAAILPALTPRIVWSQTQNPGLGLVGLNYANDVERAAAVANQATFNVLDPACNPGGALDSLPEPGGPPQGASCSDDHFFVYLNTRELVHTANEIRGSGASVASLGSDLEGLGRALRWTAAEELAAIGSTATEFANSQLSNLSARMNAFRVSTAAAPAVARHSIRPNPDTLFASTEGIPQDVLAAAETQPRETYSRWSAFLNAGFGFGDRKPTGREDAFDFDGSELTFGIDRRFPRNLVVGGILGLGEQTVDFDSTASTISVVDGMLESDATSLILFALYSGERLNMHASVGSQSVDYVMTRHIKYPSFNPDVGSANSIANSRPDANVTMATFSAGYALSRDRFTFEPIFSAEYVDIDVAAFSEQRSINLLSNAEQSKRFDLLVSGQRIESLDTYVTLRFQYTMTPDFGVAIPYLHLETHREYRDNARTITTGFAAVQDVLGTNTFMIPTDVPDETYFVTRLGFSTILRGGRQREADGPITGGLSAFVQLMTVRGLKFYSDDVLTGGLRYEF